MKNLVENTFFKKRFGVIRDHGRNGKIERGFLLLFLTFLLLTKWTFKCSLFSTLKRRLAHLKLMNSWTKFSTKYLQRFFEWLLEIFFFNLNYWVSLQKTLNLKSKNKLELWEGKKRSKIRFFLFYVFARILFSNFLTITFLFNFENKFILQMFY